MVKPKDNNVKPVYISGRALAIRLGISQTSIRKAIDSGRVIPESNGKFIFDKAQKQYMDNTDHGRNNTANAGNSINADYPSINESKQKKEFFAALKMEMEYEKIKTELDEVKRNLLSSNEVASKFDKIARAIKSTLENLPNRYSSLIASEILKTGEITPEIIERIVKKNIEGETSQILYRLSDQINDL